MFFSIPISISIILQVICAVHALKTGRNQWLWIIIFFSIIGCLIYFFVEILPDFKSVTDKVAGDVTTGVQNLIIPDHVIKKMKSELELCDSVKNRLALAQAYAGRKQYDEAIAVLQVCCAGPYGKDAIVQSQLADCYFLKGDYQKARESFLIMKGAPRNFENQQAYLLNARVLEKMGEKEEALKEYAELAQTYVGEEARCRYALFLKDQGKGEEAKKIFEDIVRKCKISPPFYRREHKMWLNIAQSELKE